MTLLLQTSVRQFVCLEDNVGLLIHDNISGTTIAVDVPDCDKYVDNLTVTGWKLSHILITHHHDDHVCGLQELKEVTNARVIGPKLSLNKIKALDVGVSDGDKVDCGPYNVIAISTPGHTLDHISWHFPSISLAHTGDVLFSLGCGRIFEGSAPMMLSSLCKLENLLPPETVIYCGHDNTVSNLSFAFHVDSSNLALRNRSHILNKKLCQGKPLLPTSMGVERSINPFLRVFDENIRRFIGLKNGEAEEVFAKLREMKDNFRV